MSNKAHYLSVLYEKSREDLREFVVFGQSVFGVGDPDSPIVFIGEAPGRFEAEQGIPFVGAAGKNLDSLFASCGVKREEIYITNAVKFRPVKDGARQGTYTNRAPNRKELEVCHDILMAELSIIQPKFVATLGNVPLRAIYQKGAPTVGDVHGQLLRDDRFPFAIFPLYHPASVIYNRSLAETLEQDMAHLAQILKA